MVIKLSVSNKQLQSTLMEQYHYKRGAASNTLRKLDKLDAQIKLAFIMWFNHGEEPRLTIEGISYREVLDMVTPDPFGAFLFMDFLKRDPLAAKSAIVSGKHKVLLTEEELRRMAQNVGYTPQAENEDKVEGEISTEPSENKGAPCE